MPKLPTIFTLTLLDAEGNVIDEDMEEGVFDSVPTRVDEITAISSARLGDEGGLENILARARKSGTKEHRRKLTACVPIVREKKARFGRAHN
jgi:hypothetical protein